MDFFFQPAPLSPSEAQTHTSPFLSRVQFHQVSECHLYTTLFLLLSHTPTTYVQQLTIFMFHKLHRCSVKSSSRSTLGIFSSANLFPRLEDPALSGALFPRTWEDVAYFGRCLHVETSFLLQDSLRQFVSQVPTPSDRAKATPPERKYSLRIMTLLSHSPGKMGRNSLR